MPNTPSSEPLTLADEHEREWLVSALWATAKRLGWEVETSPIDNGLYITLTPPSGCPSDFRVRGPRGKDHYYANVRYRGADGSDKFVGNTQSGTGTINLLVTQVCRFEVAAVTGEAQWHHTNV